MTEAVAEVPCRVVRLLLSSVLVALAVSAAGVAGAASPPGTKTPADRAAWRTILKWPKSCETNWHQAGFPDVAGVGIWPPAGGRRLVEVGCTLGAYQGTSMLYLYGPTGRVAGPLPLHVYEDPGTGTPKPMVLKVVLGLLSFAPRTGKLTVLDKFRGIGDCGIFSTFKLTGDRFVPTDVRAKLACDGKPPYDPLRWPRLPLPH